MNQKKTTSKSQSGRPRGSKDSKPRKKKRSKAQLRAAAKKAAETRRQKQAGAEVIPQVTPYPRAGENKEFEQVLQEAIPKQPGQAKTAEKPEGPGNGQLQVDDVAEWVSYPFLVWAETQKISQLKITEKEAQSVAEPLTRILNRHNVGDLIPPDVLDGMQALGRVTPLMKNRFDMIKAERIRRRSGSGQGGPAPTAKSAQGAPATKPVEA